MPVFVIIKQNNVKIWLNSVEAQAHDKSRQLPMPSSRRWSAGLTIARPADAAQAMAGTRRGMQVTHAIAARRSDNIARPADAAQAMVGSLLWSVDLLWMLLNLNYIYIN